MPELLAHASQKLSMKKQKLACTTTYAVHAKWGKITFCNWPLYAIYTILSHISLSFATYILNVNCN